MANNVLMGMAVSSGTTLSTAASSIDHVDAMINVPQVASDLVAWYRADVGVEQSSGSVSEWEDQSGNGNNVSQSTSARQPALDASILNGQPVLHFTHANSDYLSVANNATLLPSHITIFTVARNTGTTVGDLVAKSGATVHYVLGYHTNTAPGFYINSPAHEAAGTLSAGNWGMIEGEYDQNNISLYVNGTLTQTALTVAITTSTDPLYIGGLAAAGDGLDGDIAEVLIFNTALTTTQYEQVEGYLYTKYGVGVDPLPVISSAETATGTVGSAFSYAITASGSPTSFYATGLPAGLSLNTSTGVISGTPTASGNSAVTISATNAAGTGSMLLSLTVNALTPVITSSGSASGAVGTPFSYTITATNTPTSYSLNGAIPGLEFTASTGVISGTPTTAGTYSVTIGATNTGGTGTESLTVTILPPPPVITSAATATGTVGTAFSYAITATNSPTSYSLGGTIPGLSVTASTGVISGTPTTTGTYSVTIGATNAGGTGTESLTVTILPPPPVITSAATATGTVGTAFSYTITATNSPTSYSLGGTIPGLGVTASTGVISGTPTTAGTYSVTIGATNAGGTGTKSLTVTINPPPPVVTSPITATGTVGTAFSYTITATNSPTSYSLTGTSVPGLSVTASTGVISGTPTTAGTYFVTIGATNVGGTGTKSLTVTINPPPPVVTSSLTATGTVGVPFNYTITGSNGPTSFSATGSLPPTLGLNTSTGVISGTPTTAGTYSVTIGATNAGGTGTESLTVTINPPPPVITSATTATGTAGTTFSYTITATNGPTSYGLTGTSIPGLGLTASTGVISGTPTTAGTYSVTIGATNAGGTGTESLTVTINPPLPVITSATTATGMVGTAFSYTITATNSPTSYSLSEPIPGLSLTASTGVISGTPTTAGTYSVTIGATNAGGTGTAPLTLTINSIPLAAAPVFSPGAGTYATAQTVTITSATSGATIYYTTGTVTPTTSSPIASGGMVTVGSSETLNAIAVAPGYDNSSVVSAAYMIEPGAPTNVTAQAVANGIDLAWINNASNATSIQVQQQNSDGSWSTITTLDPSQTSYPVPGVTSDQVETFQIVAVNSAGSAASGSVTDLAATQIGWWKFDDGSGTTAADSSGLDNNATLAGSPVWVAGVYGDALQLSGSGQYGQVTEAPSLDLGSNSLTLSGWFKAGVTSATMPLFSKELTDSSGYHGFHVGLNASGAIEAKLGDTSGSSPLLFSTQNSFTDSQWHQFILVVDQSGQAAQIYVDGTAQSVQLGTGSIGTLSGTGVSFSGITNLDVTVSQPLNLGANPTTSKYFNGTLDDLRIYNYALSSSQLGSLIDSDGNGLPDWWEIKYFGQIGNNPSALSPAGDGYTLLQEYQMGRNPLDYYQGAAPTITIVSGNNQTVSVNSFTGNPLVVQVSTSSGIAVNAPITFSLATGTSGGLSITNSGTGSATISIRTNSQGQASLYFLAPATSENATVLASGGTSPNSAQVSIAVQVINSPVAAAGLIAGGDASFVVKTDNSLKAWGNNTLGQLGLPVQVSVTTPTAVGSGYLGLSSRGNHTLFLHNDNSVWAAGENYFGQLGTGDHNDLTTPQQINGLASIIAVATGASHSLALSQGGTVLAWGGNYAGQLGLGTTSDSLTPTTVSGLTGITAIAAGRAHSLALTSGGNVYAWGDNSYGQLGNGTRTNSSAPAQVAGLSQIIAIGAGDYFNVAIQQGGTVYVWGANSAGQLALGHNNVVSTPQAISSVSNAAAAVAGAEHLVILGNDASVMASGANFSGQLGTGDNTAYNVLKSVLSNGVTQIAVGFDHTLALKTDGSLSVFGANNAGQLGNGSTQNASSPIPVSAP